MDIVVDTKAIDAFLATEGHDALHAAKEVYDAKPAAIAVLKKSTATFTDAEYECAAYMLTFMADVLERAPITKKCYVVIPHSTKLDVMRTHSAERVLVLLARKQFHVLRYDSEDGKAHVMFTAKADTDVTFPVDDTA